MLLLFLRRWLHEWGDMEGVVGVFLSSRVGIHEEYTGLHLVLLYFFLPSSRGLFKAFPMFRPLFDPVICVEHLQRDFHSILVNMERAMIL